MNAPGPKLASVLDHVHLVPLRNGTVRICFLDTPHGIGVRHRSRWLVHPLQPGSERWIDIWRRVATHLGTSVEGWCATAHRADTTINGWQAMLPDHVLIGGGEPSPSPVPKPKLEVA
jgi:hypothetical protein